jgi:hypothetical protein
VISVALEQILKTITLDDYETILVGKSTVDLSDPSVYKKSLAILIKSFSQKN